MTIGSSWRARACSGSCSRCLRSSRGSGSPTRFAVGSSQLALFEWRRPVPAPAGPIACFRAAPAHTPNPCGSFGQTSPGICGPAPSLARVARRKGRAMDVDPKLGAATRDILRILMTLERSERAPVLTAVAGLLRFAELDLRPAARATRRQLGPRCSICRRAGHKRTTCPEARRCRACGAAGHDRRNCPDLETPP